MTGDKSGGKEEEEATNTKTKTKTKTNIWQLVVFCFYNVTIESVLFCHGGAYAMVELINTSLQIDKICQVGTTWFSNGTHYSAELCDSLDSGDYEAEQNHVQTAFARLSVASGYFGQIPAFVMVFVMGWMADKIGRRFVLCLTMLNMLVDNSLYLAQSIFFHEISPNYFMFEDIGNILGSSNSFFIAAYAFAADVSSPEFCIARMAILDIFYTGSKTIFYRVSSYIFNNVGYVGVYTLSTSITVVGLVYILLFVKESKKFSEQKLLKMESTVSKSQPKSSKVRRAASFLLNPFIDIWKVLKAERLHGQRHIVWLLLGLFLLRGLSDGCGKSKLEIAYQKKIFHWESVQEFNTFHSKVLSTSFLAQTVVLILIPFITRLEFFTDPVLSIINTFGSLGCKLFYIFAWAPAAIFAGEIVNSLGAVKNSSYRSHLSKLVEANEVGKVFSLVAFIQALLNLLISFWFMVYEATLTYNPAFIYWVGSALTLVLLAGLFYVHYYNEKVKKIQRGPEKVTPTPASTDI